MWPAAHRKGEGEAGGNGSACSHNVVQIEATMALICSPAETQGPGAGRRLPVVETPVTSSHRQTRKGKAAVRKGSRGAMQLLGTVSHITSSPRKQIENAERRGSREAMRLRRPGTGHCTELRAGPQSMSLAMPMSTQLLSRGCRKCALMA